MALVCYGEWYSVGIIHRPSTKNILVLKKSLPTIPPERKTLTRDGFSPSQASLPS